MRNRKTSPIVIALAAVTPNAAYQCPFAQKCCERPKCVVTIAMLSPAEGNEACAKVLFVQKGDKVKVLANIRNIEPKSVHGFQIHEYGDFSRMDATNAGGHYNPEDYPRTGPDTAKRHAGNLGNVVADSNGNAHYEPEVSNIGITDPNTCEKLKQEAVHAKE